MALGFTSINSSSPIEASQATTNNTVHNADDQTRSIVSLYLGRGLDAPGAPLSTGANKSAAKGKKRAAPKSDASKAKCRRMSSVKDGLQVRKVADTADSDFGKRQKKTERKTPVSNTDSVSVVGGDETSAATKSIPVFAPMTSMDALDSTSARTSFDSARARPGQSFTVYQGSSSGMSALTDAGNRTLWSSVSGSEPSYVESSTNKTSHRNFAYTCHMQETSATQDESEPTCPSPLPLQLPERVSLPCRLSEQHMIESDFSEVEDDDLIDLAHSVERCIGIRPSSPPPRRNSQNMREVDEHEDYGGALFSAAEKKMIEEIEKKNKHDYSRVRPILRKPFQPSILDRSPIWGASNGSLLRTCFRLGEALNTGSQAVRCNQDVVIELYARVTRSWREEEPRLKQHFVLKDLYHDKPPHLEGTYELWNQAVLWDLDSKPFLRATDWGIMCRAIAKMKREQQKWRLEILSIWESTWEDVNYVAGICMGEVMEEDD